MKNILHWPYDKVADLFAQRMDRPFTAVVTRFDKDDEQENEDTQIMLLPHWQGRRAKLLEAGPVRYYSSREHALFALGSDELWENAEYLSSLRHPYFGMMFQYIPPAQSKFYFAVNEYGYHLYQHVIADVEWFDGKLLEMVDLAIMIPHQKAVGRDKIRAAKLALLLWYLNDQTLRDYIKEPLKPHEYFEPELCRKCLLPRSEMNKLFDTDREKSIEEIISEIV